MAVEVLKTQRFSLFHSSAKQWQILIKTCLAVPINITSWNIEIIVVKDLKTMTPILTLTVGSGITIVTPQTGDNIGLADIVWTIANTTQTEATYVYTVRASASGSELEVIVPPSDLVIAARSRA